jgi:hypothetical protein
MYRQDMTADLSRVDWILLRQQKADLLEAIEFYALHKPAVGEGLNGILHLIDHIQDEAAETLGEEAVFGKLKSD